MNQVLIERIKQKYGISAMREKWIEELLELATKLQQSKSKHYPESELIEEIADVSFILDQMLYIYGEDIVKEVKQYKIKRTEERLFKV